MTYKNEIIWKPIKPFFYHMIYHDIYFSLLYHIKRSVTGPQSLRYERMPLVTEGVAR